jgi:SNF2 family DNA or RNA helicase
MASDPLEIGMEKLNAFQADVLKECLTRTSGGLSLLMGSGKTLISIVLALQQTQETKAPVLVVVAKTLVENWKHEIHKFFGDTLKYDILHKDYHKKIDMWKLDSDVRLVITTSDIISKYYNLQGIERYFVSREIVNEGFFNQHEVLNYNNPSNPYVNNHAIYGPSILYTRKWGCLIVDEIQKFTKISSFRCKGIAALCATHRWGLSGTMFDEPSIERLLGYHIILNLQGFPRTLPGAQKYVTSYEFHGINSTIVHRKTNEAFIPPNLKETVVSHKLTKEEENVYMSMKATMAKINNALKELQRAHDTTGARKFSSYLLAMITYLRQSIVCPLLPIANVILDMMRLDKRSEMSVILMNEIKSQGLDDWMQRPSSVISSRMSSAKSVIDSHPHERLVVFTCFRTCLDAFMHQLDARPVFTLTSTQSTKGKQATIDNYSKTYNGILLLTYDIGAEGLNLQMSHTVLLMDLWWNSGKTQQSIARVLRQGQESHVVNVYYFTSNTGIEQAMFNKHEDKLNMFNEIQHGPLRSGIRNMTVKDIINILEDEENQKKLYDIIVKSK